MSRIGLVVAFWFTHLFILGQGSLSDQIYEARTISDDVETQIQALLELTSKPSFLNHSDTLGLVHYAIAFRYKRLANYPKIIEHSELALQSFSEVNYSGYQYAFALSYLGESFKNLGQDQQSIFHFLRILEIEPAGRALEAYSYAVNELAIQFNKFEDYDSAIKIVDHVLQSSYKDEIPPIDLIRILLSSSIAHSNLKKEENILISKNQIEEAQALYGSNNLEYDVWIGLEMQRAAIALFQGQQLEASTIYTNIFEQLKQEEQTEATNESATMVAFNASYAYQEAGDFKTALEMGRLAQREFQNYGNSIFIESEYLINDNLCTSFLGTGRLDSADYYVKKGLALFGDLTLLKSEHRDYVMNLLYDQARVYVAMTTESPMYRDSAMQVMKRLDQLLDDHISEQLSDYSINNLKRLGLNYYQLAVDIAYDLDDPEAFWYYSEKTKGLQMLKAHMARRNSNQAGTSSIFIDSLNRMRTQIEFELSRQDIIESTNDSLRSILNKVNTESLQLKRELLLHSAFSIQPGSLKEMRRALNRKQVALQYQYGREDLYVLWVNNNFHGLYRIGHIDSTQALISEFQDLVSNPQKEINHFYSTSSELYEKIVKPFISDRSELIVIPDQDLHFVAFDGLRIDNSSYLIETMDVSYLPSGSFFTNRSEQQDVDQIDIYRPQYQQSSEIAPPLPYVDNEISAIGDVFTSNLLEGSDNDKSQFLMSLNNSDAFHFCGHAFVNSSSVEQSYLALSSDDELRSKVLLGELYTLNCTADLVTLSACNTGVGELIKGEGVSSLTRGFLFAGVRSVINTLWTVDDQSTSKIIGIFYKHLSLGETKSHALRLAKVEYLKTAEAHQAHPYYWAGIIGTGDMSRQLVYPLNWPKVILTLFLCIVLAIFLTWRFNKKPLGKIEFLTDWEGLVKEKK